MVSWQVSFLLDTAPPPAAETVGFSLTPWLALLWKQLARRRPFHNSKVNLISGSIQSVRPWFLTIKSVRQSHSKKLEKKLIEQTLELRHNQSLWHLPAKRLELLTCCIRNLTSAICFMLYFLRQSIHKYFLKAHKYKYYIEFDDQPAPVADRSPIHWHCSQSVRMCAIFLVQSWFSLSVHRIAS